MLLQDVPNGLSFLSGSKGFQLEIIQEVITISVFIVFAIFLLKEKDHGIGPVMEDLLTDVADHPCASSIQIARVCLFRSSQPDHPPLSSPWGLAQT
jgi:hypothetical protein